MASGVRITDSLRAVNIFHVNWPLCKHFWTKLPDAMEIDPGDRQLLERLEEELWREATRFDRARMNDVFADDFFEFGRSGRVYGREETLGAAAAPIDTRFPLEDFRARLLAPDVAQVTYNSAVKRNGAYEFGRRCSIWTRGAKGWLIRFHQGTPFEPGV
jgi:hypothetical protein